MDTDGPPPLWRCSGFTDKYCDHNEGFANDDIFFFEVCVFSMICNNNDRLFELEVGEDFRCDLSEAKYRRLQRLLQSGPVPEVSMQNDDDSW
mmetsp:Transcript_1054/g.2772  ORF Transcript_1054/g.2772 Transcript_1054/m.2772 type:complete len:92 (-) Transcript_1054:65-340(-)